MLSPFKPRRRPQAGKSKDPPFSERRQSRSQSASWQMRARANFRQFPSISYWYHYPRILTAVQFNLIGGLLKLYYSVSRPHYYLHQRVVVLKMPRPFLNRTRLNSATPKPAHVGTPKRSNNKRLLLCNRSIPVRWTEKERFFPG